MATEPSTGSPLVSILICNYNYGKFLGEAIDSALHQTYPHVEVVVVDDGSSDNSQEIIANYKDRIVPVLKENGGHASALNAGFTASHGKIVMLLDSDDYYLSPRTVERVVDVFRPDVAQVQFRMKIVDDLGNSIGFVPPLDLELDAGEVWRLMLEKGEYTCPFTSGLCFNRAVLNEIVPIPEAEYWRAPDFYLYTLAPFYGQVSSIEEALVAYRNHGGNELAFRGVPSDEYFLKVVGDRLKQHQLITHKANELGHRVPSDLALRALSTLVPRMILLRLNPQRYPLSSDRRLNSRLSLLYWALRTTWLYTSLDRKRRLIYSVWLVWVALLPSSLARLALNWLLVPESRPKVLEWVRKKIRSL